MPGSSTKRNGRPRFTARDRSVLLARAKRDRVDAQLREQRPRWFIEPHPRGQRQVLESDHAYRIVTPGNGWGKTTIMAVDWDMLAQLADPYKPQAMPDHPPTGVWFCMKYQQFEIMRPHLEKVWTRPSKWREQKHYYEWPATGARLFILSDDSDWTSIQGIELDACYFDEHPSRKFWNEMQMRRRGKFKTRFMVAATMTQGETWFVQDVIKPWQDWNRARGRTEAEANQLQDHPTTFMWIHGGIRDNPVMGQEDENHYQSITTLGEKERQVRLGGGYADFTGEAVFDDEALTLLEKKAQAGRGGNLIFLPDEDPDIEERHTQAIRDMSLPHRFKGVVDPMFFDWRDGDKIPRGRITVWEFPREDEVYVIGSDYAAGLVGKDYDTAFVGRKTADGPLVQVAEAEGWWGDVFFAEILFKLGTWYNEAFIVGERQFGLPALRRLYDEMGYAFIYHQRYEPARNRRHSDYLGHHKSAGDTVIPNHRLAIKRGTTVLRSPDAIRQHKRFQYQPRSSTVMMEDVRDSSELKMGAPSGENDDLVLCAAYATHGAVEVDRFPKPKRAYRPGTFGDVLNLDEVFNPAKTPKDPYTIRKRSR